MMSTSAYVKVLGLTQSVSDKAIEVQKEEQEKFAQEYKGQGEARALALIERAKSASKQITDFAELRASKIRSEGAQAAAEEYKKFERNPELAMFLRHLESLRTALKERTTMLLDGSSYEPARFFRDGPSVAAPGAAASTRPNEAGGAGRTPTTRPSR